MKKYNIFLILTLAILGIIGACSKDFLTVTPKGTLDEGVLANASGIDKQLIGAYSMLDGQTNNFGWEAASSGWVFSEIRAVIANKGTDAGDQPAINAIQSYTENPTNDYLNLRWRSLYDAINRCNAALTVVAKATKAGTITTAQADSYTAQAKALRGWYHFCAWRMWQNIPYLDETTDPSKVVNNVDVSDKILADLQAGTSLPNKMDQVGRFNGTVCNVLLAMAKMDMKKDWAGALANLNTAKTGTKPDGSAIGLAATYGEIFDIANRNGVEAVYTVQYSVNDGSGGRNGGFGEVLNFPYKGNGGSPGGCCGFFCPTQEYVNSFRTTAGGLPMLDNSYNTVPVKNDQGLTPAQAFVPDAGNLDPRLDWSVGRRGIPYWDWGKVSGSDWKRDQTYSGPYNPKKQVYKKSQEGQFTEVGNWTSGWTANGYRLIRYADILLLIAECQIETNDLAGARTNVNLVRARAANPAGFVMDGAVPAANYVISVYPAAGAPFDTQANARVALQMERKLELGMEGHRLYDLNRWGNTATELNRVLAYEKTMPWGTIMYGAATVTAGNSKYAIPQRQIDLSNGGLVQNSK